MKTWQEPWGNDGLEKAERDKVREDDVMMWRGIFLFIVSEEVKKATIGKEERRRIRIGIEQPADPKNYKPEVVSFWSTQEWRRLREMYGLEEQTFKQSFGGNLALKLPEEEIGFYVKKEPIKDSKMLSWAPGMMKEVAMRIHTEILGPR